MLRFLIILAKMIAENLKGFICRISDQQIEHGLDLVLKEK